jgi:hypothetical protein
MKKKMAVAISRAHIFLAIMAGVMLLAFGIQLVRQDYRDHLHQARADTAEDAKSALMALESRIFAMELVANRLATFIAGLPRHPGKPRRRHRRQAGRAASRDQVDRAGSRPARQPCRAPARQRGCAGAWITATCRTSWPASPAPIATGLPS